MWSKIDNRLGRTQLGDMKGARLGAISGLLGVTIVLVGTVLAASAYRGRAGESYSPLNHFVSELGHNHVSAYALLFNCSLIVGNISLVPFTLAVARQLGGKTGGVFGALGLLSNLSGALVGVRPMNVLVPHLFVAFIFFYACLASTALFSIHALLFPRGPWGRWIAVPGFFSVMCFIVFLGDAIRLRHNLSGVFWLLSHRPQVWLLPLSEWLVILSVLLWIILVALHLKSEDERAVITQIDFSLQMPLNQQIVPILPKHHN